MAEIRIFLNVLAVAAIVWWAFVAVIVTLHNRNRHLLDPALEVRLSTFVAAAVGACWLCAGVLHG